MLRLPQHSQFAIRKSLFAIHLLLLSFLACSSSFEGIKLRAQSPSISEASRRIGLAFRADEYAIDQGSALGLYHVTTWRVLNSAEKTPKDQEGTESRLSVRLEPRGTEYDIFLTITLRTAQSEHYPEPGHPIVVKWEKVLREIVVIGAREED